MLLDYTEDDLEETFCLNFTVSSFSSESVSGGTSLKQYFDMCNVHLLFVDHRGKLWCHRGLGINTKW